MTAHVRLSLATHTHWLAIRACSCASDISSSGQEPHSLHALWLVRKGNQAVYCTYCIVQIALTALSFFLYSMLLLLFVQRIANSVSFL